MGTTRTHGWVSLAGLAAIGLLSGCSVGNITLFSTIHQGGIPTEHSMDHLPTPEVAAKAAEPSEHRSTWSCVSEVLGEYMGDKMIPFDGENYRVEAYDRNQDHNPDFFLVFGAGAGGHESPFPQRYVVFGEHEAVFEYVDREGNGRCVDIVTVEGNPGEVAGEPLVSPHRAPSRIQIVPLPDEPTDFGNPRSYDPKEQA